MRLRRQLCVLALAAPLALGCAASQKPGTRQSGSVQARGTASAVKSEEDYTAARSDYDAMLPGEPNRLARREALIDYLLADANTALERGRADDAMSPYKQALSLYSAAELRDGTAGKDASAAKVVAVAQKLEVAFRKRGAHEQVLSALAAELALSPKDDGPKRRWGEVIGWLEASPADEEMADGAARALEDLEGIVRVFPSPFIVEEIARRYHEPLSIPSTATRDGKPSLRALRELMSQEQARGVRAYELARLYLRVSDLGKAAAELDALRVQKKMSADENELSQLLDKAAGTSSSATDWVAIAMAVIREARDHSSDDRDVALRVCRDAQAKFPKAVEPGMCSGELARSMEALGIAQRAFEAVRAIDPAQRRPWEELALLYQARLFQIVTQEDLDVSGLPAALSKVEQFHADAAKRFSQPLKVGLAGAVFEVGRGYYNAGRIDDARTYIKRSIDLEASAPALELIAQIEQKRGEPQAAVKDLERAINLGGGEKEEQLYRRARLRRLLGDAIEATGETATATQTRRGALEDWDVLLQLGLQKEFAAEALLEKGKVLYQLGDRDEALRSFARSIDALPDRGSSYADVIAFLIPRGELSDALDAYHRALGRAEVTDYLKVYCSLWIVDLARRAGQPEDALALAYLHGANGGKWFDDLARWATGRETETELAARANTPAKKAECAFYRAMKALREQKPDEASALWKQVIATDMMAFFEYDMARMYLRDGAPSTPRIAKHAAAPAPLHKREQEPSVTPPADSI